MTTRNVYTCDYCGKVIAPTEERVSVYVTINKATMSPDLHLTCWNRISEAVTGYCRDHNIHMCSDIFCQKRRLERLT